MKDSVGAMKTSARVLATILITFIVILAIQDFYVVAKGTQNWIGKFTLTWGVALAGLTGFGFLVFLFGLLNLWEVSWTRGINDRIRKARDRIGWLRWLLALGFGFIPMKIFLYTPLGAKLTGIGFRLAIFLVTAAIMSTLVTSGSHVLVNWKGVLISLIAFGSIFALGKSFVNVVDHPLSLTWSEGNRIWDYSILFGQDLYNYPPGQPIEAYIDQARQTLWGLPFLLPNVSILGVRLWSAIVFTLPYMILGWMAFQSITHDRKHWFWLGAWTFLFLFQGPIYTPLILSAILVAGARKKPTWLAIPLIYLAGYYAQGSRIHWMVGPAVWAVLIAMMDNERFKIGKPNVKDWGTAAIYGFFGFLGGFGIIRGWRRLYNYVTRAATTNPDLTSISAPNVIYINPGDSVEAVSAIGQNTPLTNQAILWERLLPNPTYGLGIILGLLLAVGPVLILLIYLVWTKKWKINIPQKYVVFGFLASLLGLGVFISTKIGGGGDLHNLDMFFVALIFVVALAWDGGGQGLISELEIQPVGIKMMTVLAVAIPAFMPWINAVPFELPPVDKTAWTLELLQSETTRINAQGGEILFMDQRQLLTFGLIDNIPLVPEYEKKLVMDKAMSGDIEYFKQFYDDISSQRFELIISDPQRIRFSEEDEGWGTENDTWVQWVTSPLLCFYEPVYTIKKTGVWMLYPIGEPGDCPYP